MQAQQPPSPQEWFNQVTVTPPAPQKQPKRKAARIIIALVVLLLLVSSVVLVIVSGKDSPFSNKTTTAECFEPATYGYLLKTINDATGESLVLADIVSDEPLYLQEVYFQPDSTDFNTAIVGDPLELLEAIGAYYKKNHKDVPFTIHLEPYYPGTDTELANRRIDVVKQILIKAGVSEDAIKLVTPVDEPADDESSEGITLEEAEENEEITDYDIDGIPVSVAIFPTPTKVCSE